MNKFIPGTNSLFENENEFENYKKMIELGNGISLSQICNITRLEPYTIQNWCKRGYIPHPINKKYYVKHLSRILLINALKECMNIDYIGKLLVYINGEVDDESDDIISEEDLYKMFSHFIYEIDDVDKLEQIIDSKVKDKKLNICMKAMCYAYYGSLMSRKSNEYLIKGGVING